ncbi:MAG: hypothetical protein Q8L26_06635 [Candidatus Omnitrophota bacterium]|nr:hypothetical protein [Candidatus Omnitrophota bacterium]
MKTKLFTTIMAVVMVLTLCAVSFAAVSQTINVTATVQSVSSSLSVGISKVTVGTGGAADTWLALPALSPMAFGTLVYDTVNKIFVPSPAIYYAVDIGVTDNTGTVWTLTQTGTSIANGINNLNNNINATFVKVTGSGTSTTDTPLTGGAVSYAAAMTGKAYTKTAISPGWMRIYYGIGTGNPLKPDNTGVVPVGADKQAGLYSGVVTITLTP